MSRKFDRDPDRWSSKSADSHGARQSLFETKNDVHVNHQEMPKVDQPSESKKKKSSQRIRRTPVIARGPYNDNDWYRLAWDRFSISKKKNSIKEEAEAFHIDRLVENEIFSKRR